jgi:hypothetical protein
MKGPHVSDPVIDLDAHRAARREAKGDAPLLRLGGQTVTLPVELPLDVFEPLTTVNVDLALVLSLAMNADGPDRDAAVIRTFVDLVAANPELLHEVLGAAKEITRRVVGDEGYAALIEWRPTLDDAKYLLIHLGKVYGISLGESSPSTDSQSSDGGTSNPTSNTTTPDSTPETPSVPQDTPPSSE